GTPLVIEPSPGRFSGDAGLLPVRPLGQSINLTGAFAEALDDPRHPDRTEPTFPEMVWSRVSGILSGYADPNDPDTLLHDPVFEPVADRSPDDNDCQMSRWSIPTRWPDLGNRPSREVRSPSWAGFRGCDPALVLGCPQTRTPQLQSGRDPVRLPL